MAHGNGALAAFWQQWRPRGPLLRLVPLCLLGWLIVNSSALSFMLGMEVYGSFPTFSDYMVGAFSLLSGISWVKNWGHYWQWLPLLTPLFLVSGLIWLKKPSIFTAGLLAVSGMATGPANRIFLSDLPLLSAPFAAVFLACAWVVQKIWNNWDAPAPSPQERDAQREKRAQKWPLKKKLILLAVPVLIYAGSSCLCALGGAYRQECAVAVLDCAQKPDRYRSPDWKASTFTHKWKSAERDFSLPHLIAETWKDGEFSRALLGRWPYSWRSFLYNIGSRFSFVVFFTVMYALWFWRPTWLFYSFTTAFFLTGVAWAKSRLVWQFLDPVSEYPELRELVPNFLYLWAEYSPF